MGAPVATHASNNRIRRHHLLQQPTSMTSTRPPTTNDSFNNRVNKHHLLQQSTPSTILTSPTIDDSSIYQTRCLLQCFHHLSFNYRLHVSISAPNSTWNPLPQPLTSPNTSTSLIFPIFNDDASTSTPLTSPPPIIPTRSPHICSDFCRNFSLRWISQI